MKDKSQGCHFNHAWEFTENGYRNTSTSMNEDATYCSEEQDYDYREGVRGDPDADPSLWVDISISHTCGPD